MGCDEPKCKLHSDGYVAARYVTHSTSASSFCADGLLSESFVEHGDKEQTCKNRCTMDTRCKYYSLWESGWCRLTSSCSATSQDGSHSIVVRAKLDGSSTAKPSLPTSTPRPVPSEGSSTTARLVKPNEAGPGTTPDTVDLNASQRGITTSSLWLVFYLFTQFAL